MSIFSYESDFIKTERIEIGEIPCLRFRPKDSEGILPTVIYYHGWSSCKEYQRFKASVLSVYGYQLIVPDALHHGERNPIDYNVSGSMSKYFLKTILQSLEESPKLIKAVIEDYQADPNRIAVMGSSMGGFTGAGVFAMNRELKCFVNYNGACGWGIAEDIFEHKKGNYFSEEQKAMLEKFDPMNNLDKIVDRPILMVHGDCDTSVPIESERIFYKKVEPLYKDKEKLKLVEIPRMNHYISTGMLEEGITWLKKYL